MQAVDKQVATVTSQRFIRVMAGFGMIVAALLIVAAVISAAVLVHGGVATKTTVNPTSINAPTDLAFRAGERTALTVTQSSSALQNAFRSGERGDGSLSAVALQNAFRSGERGDPTSH